MLTTSNMNNFQFRIFNFQFAAIFCLLLLPSLASAMTVVEIDTGNESINAIEGSLTFLEEPKEVYIGNSAILVWIESPKIVGRTVTFSGITPGGFRGQHPIFMIEGEATIKSEQITALKADGSGSIVPIRLILKTSLVKEDTAPPEPFEISIGNSPDTFNGKHFASFAAQDKGVGVESYEYASTWLLKPESSSWRTVTSPVILSRMETFKKIHVRARDKSGNYREVSTVGPYFNYSVLFGVIMLLCIIFSLKRSFSRFF